MRKAIRYAFLAPDIVRAIVEGRQPVGLTSSYLLHHPLPDDWGRCCTARSKSLTSLCRLQSHPAQYVSGIPSAAILLSISHPNSVFNSLPRQRSSPHLRPDDRLVTIDRVLHHASLGVA